TAGTLFRAAADMIDARCAVMNTPGMTTRAPPGSRPMAMMAVSISTSLRTGALIATIGCRAYFGGPNIAGLNSRASVAGREGALGAESDGEDALVLGRVGASWTRTLRLGERDRLPVEVGLDAGVENVNRETEATHRVPVVDHAHGPEIEARIAGAGGVDRLEGGTVAEWPAGDDHIAIPDLSVGPVHRSRDVEQPEVLVAAARRPGGGQIELTAIEIDPIRDEAERDRVAAAEQAGAGEV